MMKHEGKLKKYGCLTCTEEQVRRRDFLRVGSLGLLGISLGSFLQARSVMAAAKQAVKQGKAEACILLWLEGGASQVDTWDPKPNSNFRAISSNVPGIQVSELLPRCAKHMDKLSIIRTMQTEEQNHPAATHYAVTGHRPNPAMQFPGFGAVISREKGRRDVIPPHVLVPDWGTERQYENYFGSAFIGAEFNPMVIPDPSADDFEVADLRIPKSITPDRIQDRRTFMKIWDNFHREKAEMAEYGAMDNFRQRALDMLTSQSVRDAFDLSQEPDAVRDRYGRDGVGQSVLMARRLVEAGSRFVTAAGYKTNQWDAHQDNDQRHRDLLVPPLDLSLAALLEDLEERGMLESTIVISMGEFGRTPHINANLGRDHWPDCWSLVLGGGGIRGGQVIGESDDRGAYIADRRVTMGDVFATIYKAMGIDWTKEYMHPIGRPIKIANSIDDETGRPIEELL
jgi:uncharacterized protein (DUF1501 family)